MALQNYPHTYTVSLMFQGEGLVSDHITEKLLLNPTRWSNALDTDVNNSNRKRKYSSWSYDGKDESGFQDEWPNLEDGLLFLLHLVSPRKKEIIELSNIYRGSWWCGHFQSTFDGGPLLSAKLLAEIAGFELPLYIDNYFSCEEPPDACTSKPKVP